MCGADALLLVDTLACVRARLERATKERQRASDQQHEPRTHTTRHTTPPNTHALNKTTTTRTQVEEYADEVFDLLDNNGAHIFFCGLKGMMPGIQVRGWRVCGGAGCVSRVCVCWVCVCGGGLCACVWACGGWVGVCVVRV